MKFIKWILSIIIILIIAFVIFIFFPRNVENVAEFTDHKIEKVNVLLSTGEETENITITDYEAINEIISIFSEKTARKRILKDGYSNNPNQTSILIRFVYEKNDNNKVSSINVLSAKKININSARYLLYGNGIDKERLEKIINQLNAKDI